MSDFEPLADQLGVLAKLAEKIFPYGADLWCECKSIECTPKQMASALKKWPRCSKCGALANVRAKEKP